jgi:hypothetical protein
MLVWKAMPSMTPLMSMVFAGDLRVLVDERADVLETPALARGDCRRCDRVATAFSLKTGDSHYDMGTFLKKLNRRYQRLTSAMAL